MPRRDDIKSILLIGSGPITIGQACEFDYSGTQALAALKEEGYRLILVNSNPATIMTDPELADRTYIEPITPDFVERIINKERPDALLTTMGGQTALNIVLELNDKGVFEEYGCELIGAKIDSIRTAEDRELFRSAMEEIGLQPAKSGIAHSLEEAESVIKEIGYPCIIRPSRTLGGSGGGIISNQSQVKPVVSRALNTSPNREILIEESLVGWKEIELEVMRDLKDNVVIVCGIENFDPMGVHTGDSITVAPIQTLTDKEYQALRTAAIQVIRRIGVDTGGSNIQFAIHPDTGKIVIIEMNPRVSRSSALVSKATGFPIAKIAAKLAVGYTLDEIPNDITRETPACFEPSIDYVVVKIPRFNFEKFPFADPTLGTQMKSVGEVMAIGRNFQEAIQKAVCSLEIGSYGFDRKSLFKGMERDKIIERCKTPTPERLWFLAEAFRLGATVDELYKTSGIDPWFLREIEEIVAVERALRDGEYNLSEKDELLNLKKMGFSDRRIASLTGRNEEDIREGRAKLGVKPAYKTVDTCAAEFVAFTPYLYSSYDRENENHPPEDKKIIILGSGPNRIGQGIEFDYCCVHAVFAFQELGYKAVMVNCNPETVSTDYNISDRLYFEPLTLEHVLEIIEIERPVGVVVQFGGQTPLKLSGELERLGVPIIGTSVESIDIAEDRERFTQLIEKLSLRQPEHATAKSIDDAIFKARKLGYPLMIRPSFVLGGRAMRVIHDERELMDYFAEGLYVSNDRPVLLDRYLHNAIEVDVDCVSDGSRVVMAGIMEHIERAGIHSGDSSCAIPPPTLSEEVQNELRRQTELLADALNVRGLMNVQFAVAKFGEIYILEVNPRASRTVPFVSKATGIPWAKVAAKVMAGVSLEEQGILASPSISHVAVKTAVFPFHKFAGVDRLLGPEMKSTGEVMGIDGNFGGSFFRAQYASQNALPVSGTVFISLADDDKEAVLDIMPDLISLGFRVVATRGTCDFLRKNGFKCMHINKVREGSPHIVDMLSAGEIDLVINTPEGIGPLLDSKSIRLVANEMHVPTYTTVSGASAAVEAMKILKDNGDFEVLALQDRLKGE
ncbi:MAG: carbamoyl-phosphate synthase large subunit [Candidatus Dadabacteria bacterium]|nr:MAG: carbamoyl-phosphate synthase large subunit [Candidatus Dadabacteria bacterium]